MRRSPHFFRVVEKLADPVSERVEAKGTLEEGHVMAGILQDQLFPGEELNPSYLVRSEPIT